MERRLHILCSSLLSNVNGSHPAQLWFGCMFSSFEKHRLGELSKKRKRGALVHSFANQNYWHSESKKVLRSGESGQLELSGVS
jgi:hypothetical protein